MSLPQSPVGNEPVQIEGGNGMEANKAAKLERDPAAIPTPRVLVITSHGIRTFGGWQDDLESRLNAAAKKAQQTCTVLHYRYPYFSAIDYLLPGMRGPIERQFQEQVQRAIKDAKPDAIYFVGHSFGTEVIMRSLDRILSIDSSLPVRGVILSGSTLPESHPWDRVTLFAQGNVWLLNECSRRDIPLLFSKLLRPTGGAAGRFGLRGLTGHYLFNRYYDIGHSDFFTPPYRDRVLDSWVQLIVNGTSPARINEPPKNAMTQWGDSLASSFALLRALFILSPLWILCLIILAQWHALSIQNEALRKERDRVQAERNAAILQRDLADSERDKKNKQFQQANEQINWLMETISRQREIDPKTRDVFLKRLQEWVFVEESDPQWQKTRDLQRASFYIVRGNNYERDGLYDQAMEDYKSAVAIFSGPLKKNIETTSTARPLAAFVRAAGAKLLLKRKAPVEAKAWLAEAEKLVAPDDYTSPALAIRNNVARCYSQIADLAESDDERYKLFSEVLERFNSIGASDENAYDRYWVCVRLGQIHVVKHEFAKGRKYYQDSLQIIGYDAANRQADEEHQRWALSPTVEIGRALYQEGDVEAAKRVADEALPLALLTLQKFEREGVAHEQKEQMGRDMLFFAFLSSLVGNRDSFAKFAEVSRVFYESISPTRLTREQSIVLVMVYGTMLAQGLQDASKEVDEELKGALEKVVKLRAEEPQSSEQAKARVYERIMKPMEQWASDATVLKAKAELLLVGLEAVEPSPLVASARKPIDMVNPANSLETMKAAVTQFLDTLDEILSKLEQPSGAKGPEAQ